MELFWGGGIRMAIKHPVLNGLGVFVADIRNAYLQAPSSHKVILYVVQSLD